MTCIKQIFSKRRRIKVGAAFTSCRRFRAELVRNLLSWSTPVCFIEHCICSIALKLTSQVNFPTWQVRHESSGLPIIHHSGYACDLPPNHRFPMGKFPRVLHFLIKDQVITEKQVSGKKKKILLCDHNYYYLLLVNWWTINPQYIDDNAAFPWFYMTVNSIFLVGQNIYVTTATTYIMLQDNQ